uniref:ribosomal protein L32 n=1 Tax=Gracilaria urvillei TaxID=172974 RepID=UPI001D113617|nr:ribosomal protein L32 [Hydropuntia urvillei]UAD88352.1 ribosomal protein L32 [Hydropuntia urvillei]
MAVPKKRTSKSKCKSRKAQWKQKTINTCKKSISLGKSTITGKSNSYIYIQEKQS